MIDHDPDLDGVLDPVTATKAAELEKRWRASWPREAHEHDMRELEARLRRVPCDLGPEHEVPRVLGAWAMPDATSSIAHRDVPINYGSAHPWLADWPWLLRAWAWCRAARWIVVGALHRGGLVR